MTSILVYKIPVSDSGTLLMFCEHLLHYIAVNTGEYSQSQQLNRYINEIFYRQRLLLRQYRFAQGLKRGAHE